jgi:hypothetical protein
MYGHGDNEKKHIDTRQLDSTQTHRGVDQYQCPLRADCVLCVSDPGPRGKV